MSLRVTDLRVYYATLAGDVKAIDGVTFGIADGEIIEESLAATFPGLSQADLIWLTSKLTR